MTTFHNLVLASGAEGVGDLELADKLDSLCLSNYHNAKSNQLWKDIYLVGDYELLYIEHNNIVPVPKTVEAAPCHNCGLVVPLGSIIQMDHYIPQRLHDAGQYMEFITKAFRVLKLTIEGPQGVKGRRFLGTAGAHEVSSYPKQNPTGEYGKRKKEKQVADEIPEDSNQRWRNAQQNYITHQVQQEGKKTLNDRGELFLRVLCVGYLMQWNKFRFRKTGLEPEDFEQHQLEALKEISRKCMNSLANIVPLCAACNRNKG